MLNLEQIERIDRQAIWLEITDTDLQISKSLQQPYPNLRGLNNARLNQLCLTKIGAWLTAAEINYRHSLPDADMYSLWDVQI